MRSLGGRKGVEPGDQGVDLAAEDRAVLSFRLVRRAGRLLLLGRRLRCRSLVDFVEEIEGRFVLSDEERVQLDLRFTADSPVA